MKNILILMILALSLQGCFFVAGAAAGAAGVAVVYDHRKIEKIIDDQKIVSAISDKIKAEPELRDNSHISITCYDHVVLLTGEATTAKLRRFAEELTNEVPGIKRVYNEITIQGPSSSLTRTSDSWITTKIRTQMLATDGLKSGSIKVVTENGSVYLLGSVKHNQADIAVDIARQVSGVQRVVKMFQYTD